MLGFGMWVSMWVSWLVGWFNLWTCWLIGWLAHWSISLSVGSIGCFGRSFGRLARYGRSVVWSFCRSVCWLVGYLISLLVGWSVGWFVDQVGQMFGHLAGRLFWLFGWLAHFGWSVVWLFSRSVGRLAIWLVYHQFIGWPIGWLVGSLVDQLIGLSVGLVSHWLSGRYQWLFGWFHPLTVTCCVCDRVTGQTVTSLPPVWTTSFLRL